MQNFGAAPMPVFGPALALPNYLASLYYRALVGMSYQMVLRTLVYVRLTLYLVLVLVDV